jgi:integrase
MPAMNPCGKHRPKRRHPGEGTVVRRRDRWRAKPWAAVVPYIDEAGRRRQTWLSAESRDEAEALRKAEVERIRSARPRTTQTVGGFVTAWLDTLDVGPGTWPRYQQHVTVRILPSFGDTPIDELRPQDVRSALIDWPGSAATRGGTLRLLRAAMKQAVSDRLVEFDPTAGIPYPRLPHHQAKTLTGPDAKRLMELVKGERFGPILVVSLGLGLRRGEALGLRTEDVDLEGRSLTVSKSLRYIAPALRAPKEGPYRLKAPKTGETRTIPLPAFVAESLRLRLDERDAERRAAKVYAPNDFVFCDPLGNSVPLETLRQWFLGALKRAGLPVIRWHDLRASTVTVLLDEGVDLLTIQAIVGHRDLDTTRRYVGRTPKASRAAADKLDEVMG